MSWIYLLLAGGFEIIWTVGLKNSNGFTRFWPSFITIVASLISMGLLAMSMRHIPLGTAYAIWTGIGVLGAILAGIILFQETLNPSKILFGALIFIGILGIKFSSAH